MSKQINPTANTARKAIQTENQTQTAPPKQLKQAEQINTNKQPKANS